MTTKTNAGAPAKTKLEGDEEGAPAPETTEEEVDMKAALGGIGKALAGIAEGQGKILAALQAIAPKEEEETTEMNADQKRVNQLEAEVRKLQRQNVLMELEGKGITGQVAEGLVELAHLAPEKYSSTVSELAARYEQPVAKVQSEIGTTGTAATGGGISAKKVLEAATAAGVKLGGGALPKWVQDNYPSQFDEVMAEAGLL